MKSFKKYGFLAGMAAMVSSVVFFSCKYDVKDLLPHPTASFTATPIPGSPNKYALASTSTNAWRYDWDKGGGLTQGKQLDTVYYIYAGTYTVKLRVFGQNGIDSASQQITVAASDPTACVGTQLGFITSCTSKKWKLDPTAAAYKVGPGANDGSWWSSGAGDVAARSCEFNDEYLFEFSANRTFSYNNLNDFYADGYMGNNTNGCEPDANYTAVQKPWGSGEFKYSFIPDGGINHLGQLTVTGLGAHIGLQKVRNGSEVTSGPATTITYDVLAETHDPAGYDLLTLGVAIASPGWWTFRLRSF